MSPNHMSAQEIEGQFQQVFSDVSEDGKAYYITEQGKARAVIVNVDRYHAMLDALEDFGEHDPADEDLIQKVLGKAHRA
ncbi:MAG: type II toxin-antitoxin system Phd/YefM family antitoxin [Acidobacteria bacterium]|nr:type II toxin-antitoxin system Phd/YefM family antitoxin [Acidobacteriota bacterium]